MALEGLCKGFLIDRMEKLTLRRILVLLTVTVLAMTAFSVEGRAQVMGGNDEDSLVVLISSKSAQVVDIEGAAYRKVIGPARFFHNNTYLLCDTAFWNVDSRFIDAVGHVQILQEETVLSGDKLTYLIDDNLAQFRGTLVQLTDKDNNTLRTNDLDYNTKDSVATFTGGGAMRDKDGQIIESLNGKYDSKAKLFSFRDNVNMFSDTVFVKTTALDYNSETSFATFGASTDLWNKENMLSADDGWYDRSREIFLFNRNVHIMTDTQEAWCDSVYYYRALNNVTMLGNVQIIDTTRNVSAVAGRAEYRDSTSSISLRRSPAVLAKTTGAEGEEDTVYVAADFIDYRAVMMFKVDSAALAQSAERLKGLETDAIGTYRRKAAEEAAKAAEQAAMENDANYAAKKAAEEIKAKRGGAPGGDGPGKGVLNEPSAKGMAPGDRPGKKGEELKKPEFSGLDRAGLDFKDLSSLSDAPKAAAKDSLSKGSAVKDSLEVRKGASDSLNVHKDSVLAVSDSLGARKDSLSMASDSLGIKADSLAHASDSLSAAKDSLAAASDSTLAPVQLDSTKMGFLSAMKNVRLFRKDAQIVCDSLLYCDLDSLARLYKEPLVWQEGVRQYAADSIYVVIRNSTMDRAALMSNAFISIEEDTLHYDQIKSAEMMAYFDGANSLRRFDALGGVQALFYIKENDALATVNKADSKMLTASFKEGELQRLYYYDAAKNDGYPIVQMKDEERQLKGFNWQPERRPKDRTEVTTAEYRAPERGEYLAHPEAEFKQTNRYFPGYMKGIWNEIAFRDSLHRVREAEAAFRRSQEEARRRDSLSAAASADSLALRLDSLGIRRDSLGVLRDSLGREVDSLGRVVADSLKAGADSLGVLRDSIGVAADSLAVGKDSLAAGKALSPKEQKAAQKEARKKARQEAREKRQAASDARWAEKERKREEKAKAKEAKKLERLREKKRRALKAEIEEAEREKALFEKYLNRYSNKKKAE